MPPGEKMLFYVLYCYDGVRQLFSFKKRNVTVENVDGVRIHSYEIGFSI